VIVAGRKAPAIRRAARLGDGWLPFLYSPEQYAAGSEALRTHAESVGRTLDDFQWMCFVYVSLDDDVGAARAKAVDFIGSGQAGDGTRFAALVDRVAAIGAPGQVADRLQAFVDVGVRHFVLLPCERSDPAGAARRLMTEVVPQLDVHDAR
jgi:alkanesulfonate monooxygenase SsuD/methylene tetrahydromethanopterin reductase-like flavin-dependent oxidoreductase (luciferase family)